MKRKTKAAVKKIAGIVFCGLVYLFLFMPIVVIVTNSFNATTAKPYQIGRAHV